MTESAPVQLNPDTTAVLLMDFQPAVLSMLPSQHEVLDGAKAVLSWARARSARVVHVRVAFTQDDLAAIPPTNLAFAAVAEHGMLADGDPATDVHPDIKVDDADIMVRKTRFGAFSTTDLNGQLTASGIDTLVLCGVSTSGVVLSTLREAADRDYRIVLVADAMTDPDPTVHQTLIERVFPHQATVITSAALV
jgi:nicotinamidase-related amidase